MCWQDEIVEKLSEIVVWKFASEEVSYERVKDYIDQITLDEDWREKFASNIYNIYLKKISRAGDKLEQKLI